ncbi:MAG: PAS domain S-box protein [Pseudodesulfovibrio sp.]|nr:PAS domain S-box protein [Pseudodesulfovibrio sp.]
MSKTAKEFIKLFGPLALVICIASAWFLYSRNENHRELIAQRQVAIVASNAKLIAHDMSSFASDTRFLARLVAHRLENQPDNTVLKELEIDFANFAQSRRFYFILRFLGDTGMESIRLDRTYSAPNVIPIKALQDKSDRYYFQEALKAGKGGVYVSRFDLNIEHDSIQKPLKPTLRFACPVIDNTNRKRGVVILNLDGTIFLNHLNIQATSGAGIPMITTGQGYWILGSEPADEWGHILKGKEKVSMPNRFPQAWAHIAANQKGQILTHKGLFTFNTVGVAPDSVSYPRPGMPEATASRWIVMTWVPSAMLIVPWVGLFLVLAFLFLILLSVGCFHMADYRIRQAEVEDRLRANEEQTVAISQSSQDAIVMVDNQNTITYWNPAAERLFGYDAAEVLGHKLNETLSMEGLPSDAPKDLRQLFISDRNHPPGRIIEFNALCKDRSLVPVELAVSSFKLKGKWYAVGSMRDISHRKQNEMELKRSEETSRALINAPTESAMLIKPNGTIIAVNDIGASRLGGTVEDVVGENVFKLISLDFTQSHKKKLLRVLKTGKPTKFESTHADSRLSINVYPTKSPDGSVDRLAIFIRDVTEQHLAETALRESEQRFRDISEAIGEYIWETDKEGRFSFLTDDVTLVIGYTPKELMGRTPFSLMPKEDIEDFKEWHSNTYGQQNPFSNIELRNITKNGQIIWLQISGVPYFDTEKKFRGYRGAAMNITDRKATEIAIKTSERKIRALAESAYDAIIMIDTNGRVSFWNHAAEKLFGFNETEVMGKEVHSLIAPEELRPKAELGMYEFAMTGTGPAMGMVQETTGQHKNGTTFPVERSVSAFRLGQEWFAVATIRDITKRQETEAKLRELATTDSLTGLNNRRQFMELSEREFARSLRYGRPMSMFMMDIDHFKLVNDTHGHDIGDEVLRFLSEISIIALRNADILGRIGGEEFGVLLSETDEQAAMEVAERLRNSIERATIPTKSGELNITVSIGVATLDPETKALGTLLKRADVALYEAKQTGRNRSVRG